MTTESTSSLLELLNNLTISLDSAAQSAPEAIDVPADGLSLLNVKNEIFLSYLENLVFLIVLKLRHYSQEPSSVEAQEVSELHRLVVKKLAELRLYLDKGIRPLEGRLKYQIDKVIRAAEEASRPTQNSLLVSKLANGFKPSRRRSTSVSGGSDNSDSDASIISHTKDLSLISHRPNLSAFASRSSIPATTSARPATLDDSNGLYKPPRITPTALPTTDGPNTRSKELKHSRTLDEFITEELSTAPLAMPSIGSNVRAGGRAMETQRERNTRDERTRYEEDNFTRLPTTKAKGKIRGKEGKDFGGEEWTGLGKSVDRIVRGSRKMGGGGGNALERSRKRFGDSADSSGGKRRKF
jgi:U3 small nucleolar ribonucleoprotein protein LCP5